MSLLLMLPACDLPSMLHRTLLSRLYHATAQAFRCPAPPLGGLAAEEILVSYATFTTQQVLAAMREGELRPGDTRQVDDLVALQARLYEQAYALGRWSGRLMGVHSMVDAMVAGRTLYRGLDIDFRGNAKGEVMIPRCFFSRWYTPQVCRIMSAMDRGIMAGLLGGGELCFRARITEGAPCCLAHFGAPRERRTI